MLRRVSLGAVVALLALAGIAAAADKEVRGKVVKVNVAKNMLTIKTDAGNKEYEISDDTKFLGPKGGVSEERLKDDRLVKGAEIVLLVAGNNRTVREVRLPLRKGEKAVTNPNPNK